MIGASYLPVPPATLYKNLLLSNKTALTISWDQVQDTELPITGYILQVADFGSVDFKTIFEGKNQPSNRQFTLDGFITGAKYKFRVISVNFNGQSAPSDEFTFNMCSAPSEMP